MNPEESLSPTAGDPDPISNSAGYIVVGFYTPNYAPLAEKFEANLRKFNIPRMLYPVPASAWKSAIILKSQIVARAMRDFPGKTVVLMDIDCVLFGSIDPILSFDGDVSLFVAVKLAQRRMDVVSSSRVVVWRPTSAARRLCENWEQLCREQNPKAPEWDDEALLMKAISRTSGLSLHVIDPRYSGRDPKDAPRDAVVIHHSAHNEMRAASELMPYLKQVRRAIVSKLLGKPYVAWKYKASSAHLVPDATAHHPEDSHDGR